jgi:hypothetical protein
MIQNRFQHSGCKQKGYVHQLIRPFLAADGKHVNMKISNMDTEKSSYRSKGLLIQQKFRISKEILEQQILICNRSSIEIQDLIIE